jgi:hypothetical protein
MRPWICLAVATLAAAACGKGDAPKPTAPPAATDAALATAPPDAAAPGVNDAAVAASVPPVDTTTGASPAWQAGPAGRRRRHRRRRRAAQAANRARVKPPIARR